MSYDFRDDYCTRARRARRWNEFVDFALFAGVVACILLAWAVAQS